MPSPRPRDLERVGRLLGVRDAAAVAAEPFSMWVIEDRFPAGRPAWEAAGAELVADAAPFEAAKLRLLNATHSALAYLGSLAGAATVDRALALPGMAAFAEDLTRRELLPTLRACPGLDPERYRARVLARLANPALGHTTRQVAADGTEKLPVRIVAPLREHLAAGRVPQRLLLVVAAWMRHVTTARHLDDPRAETLRGAAARAGTPARVVDSLLGLREVFDPETAASAEVRTALTAHLRTLTRHGVTAALRHAAG